MRFEKVSFETFKKDLEKCGINMCEEVTKELYDEIKLPERKTSYSAGYDFYTPIPFFIDRNMERVIPTGIKCYFSPEDAKAWCLKLYPRSSLGINYGIVLRNLVGIIDADYYDNPDNEGDILISLHNNNGLSKRFNAGERVMQGIFEIYGVTTNDQADGLRVGGVGSTGK